MGLVIYFIQITIAFSHDISFIVAQQQDNLEETYFKPLDHYLH